MEPAKHLLVLITNEVDAIPVIMSTMMERQLGGATVVDSQGMLTTLNQASDDPPPIFGSLRRFLNPEHENGKMMFMVLTEDKVAQVKEIIHSVCGNLFRPNTGILFTIPVFSVEGVPNKE